MDNEESIKLTRWVVILPLFSIVITVAILAKAFYDYEKEFFDKSVLNARQEIMKKSKIDAYDKITEIANFIETNRKALNDEAKDEVKQIVNIATEVINSTYIRNKNLSREKVLEKIKKRLRDVRFFNNNSGYYFIYDMKGNCIMLPTATHLEGKNLLYLKDSKGTYTIKEHIKIAKTKKEGFHKWYWYKKDGGIMKSKIGFVKAYEQLGIYIGTAIYEEDILSGIKKNIQKLLINARYGERGYIFAYDYEGNTISHKNEKFIGKNLLDFNRNGKYPLQEFISGARANKDGFFVNYLPHSGESNYKISFIKDVPKLGWIIGTGSYSDEIISKIEKKHILLREQLSASLSDAGYMIFVILLSLLVVAYMISTKLKNILKQYQKTMLEKQEQTEKQKKQLAYQLEYDHLTSLPNRILLNDRLDHIIALSKREKRKTAVMFIDIDNFKDINDTLGHDIGDIIIKKVGTRLKNSVREYDIVSRFGGDEFVIVVDNYKSTHNLIAVIEKIQKAVKKPILIGIDEYRLTFSIGISLYPEDGKTSQVLLKNADIAMFNVKNSGKDKYRFFAKHMDTDIHEQIEMEKGIYKAIENNEFVLYYQPLVDMKRNKIEGVEALIRWNHPEQGMIYPDAFIPIAEQSNLIVALGKWVINEAMRQMSEWKSKGYDIEKMAINIATRQLESTNMISCVEESLKKNSCKPEWIELEVVERYVMQDVAKSTQVLNVLRNMGIDISIDDFGTGYSSLAYLKNLPVTKLKIDRAFVTNIDKNLDDRAIAKTIISLGNGLSMKVLAEGVETEEEKNVLIEDGCYRMQGYLFSKPKPAEEVAKLLEKGSI